MPYHNPHITKLVVSTPLKNIFVKMGSSSPNRRLKSQIFEWPPPSNWVVVQPTANDIKGYEGTTPLLHLEPQPKHWFTVETADGQ